MACTPRATPRRASRPSDGDSAPSRRPPSASSVPATTTPSCCCDSPALTCASAPRVTRPHSCAPRSPTRAGAHRRGPRDRPSPRATRSTVLTHRARPRSRFVRASKLALPRPLRHTPRVLASPDPDPLRRQHRPPCATEPDAHTVTLRIATRRHGLAAAAHRLRTTRRFRDRATAPRDPQGHGRAHAIDSWLCQPDHPA